MKKLIHLAFVGILAIAMVFAVVHLALAQDQSLSEKSDSAKEDGHGKWGHFDGFKKKLGLNDEQETQLKDLFKSKNDEFKPLRDQMELDKDKLKLLVDKNASESELTDSMDKVSADQKALQAAQEKFQQKIKGILTPKQQAQMMVLRGGHRRRGFGRWGWGGKWGWRNGQGRDGHWDKSKKANNQASSNTDQN